MDNFTACRRSPLGLLPGQTVAGTRFRAPSTGCASPSRGKKGGLGVRSGRPNTGKEPGQVDRKSLQSKAVVAVAGRQRFHLRPTGLEF